MTGKSKSVAVDGPDPIDLHVGAQLRTRRKGLHLSQDDLAKHLGLTFQQVQKYERGANRVSASMLFRAAEKLQVGVEYFFEGLEQGKPATPSNPNPAIALVGERGGLEIAQRYIAARPTQQVALIACARALTPHVEAA